MRDVAVRQQRIQLGVGQGFEERLLAQDVPGGGLHLPFARARGPFDLNGSEGQRNLDAVTMQAVPDVGAHGVGHFVKNPVVVDPELKFIFEVVVVETFQEGPDPRFRQDALGVGGGVDEDFLHARGRRGVIHTDRKPQRV